MTSTRRSVLFEKSPRASNGKSTGASSTEDAPNQSGVYPAGAAPVPTSTEAARERGEDLFSTKVMEGIVLNYILSRF